MAMMSCMYAGGGKEQQNQYDNQRIKHFSELDYHPKKTELQPNIKVIYILTFFLVTVDSNPKNKLEETGHVGLTLFTGWRRRGNQIMTEWGNGGMES